MNKIQIKAEILATLATLSTLSIPNVDLINDLRNIEDKKTIFEILIKELLKADEHKSLLICWMLFELIDKDMLNNELWEVIKNPEYGDNIKMIAFNMLKDLGSEIDYEVISEYFEKFSELINKDTKELLDVAIMNPEAQIDFMDFLNSLEDEDKCLLIQSLEDDYAGDALANILIPVYLYYLGTDVGNKALDVLGRTKSQLAFHALENVQSYANKEECLKIKKALSALKISGIRVDGTAEFYKEILKESKPFKAYTSFPDSHGNLAVLFSRKRENHTLQFLAVVINHRYGVLDAFGFNSMQQRDFYRILDKFYGNNEKYEISCGAAKYLLTRAEMRSQELGDSLPYEYICWQSILLDIELEEVALEMQPIELGQNDIDELCLSNYVQNWFFDEITSSEFKNFINNLTIKLKNENYNIDLDKYIAEHFDEIYTEQELQFKREVFLMAAYLRNLCGDTDLAQKFFSLDTNYAFLTNIIRKSIYEYYVGKRYILKNKRNTSNIFETKMLEEESFELLELDLIISTIENKWVAHA